MEDIKCMSNSFSGSFAPAYEYVDVIPDKNLQKIIKKVCVKGEWEDRIFIIINDGSNRGPVQQWLSEHYGPSQYGVTWWSTFTSVCMQDKIYTHWKLCE